MQAVKPILALIGRTPVVKLTRVTQGSLVTKLEYFNPTGSLKDRIALRMIEAAERSGALCPGDTIVDASTGNTGISLAFVGGGAARLQGLDLPPSAGRCQRGARRDDARLRGRGAPRRSANPHGRP